jgi:AraC-like DNA-binding protein
MNRKKELSDRFMISLQNHFEAIDRGEVEEMYTADEFSAELNVHAGHLGDIVREMTGKSICDWLNERTLEYIKDKLLNTDMPIKAISEKLTFHESSNFTKYFKKHTGETPKSFRKSQIPQTSPFSGAGTDIDLQKKSWKL